MWTAERLMANFNEGIAIRCNNAEDRDAVVRFLLDHDVPHGSSGYSKRILNGECRDEWMCVVKGTVFEGIEFYPTRHNSDDILFCDVEHIIYSGSRMPLVDDLL